MILRLLLALLLAQGPSIPMGSTGSNPLGGPPTLVQDAFSHCAGSAGTCTLTFSGTANNAIAFYGLSNNGALGGATVTDNCNTSGGGADSYTTLFTNTVRLVAYTLIGATKSCTLTMTWTPGTNSVGMYVQEVTNVNQFITVATNNYATNQHNGPGTGVDAITSGTLILPTPTTNAFISSVCWNASGAYTTMVSGTGETATGTTSTFGGTMYALGQYKVQIGTGSPASTCTDATNGGNIAIYYNTMEIAFSRP